MDFNFKKGTVVGVSVSAERGLEVAQVDFNRNLVLKYVNKPLVYDNNRKEIADLDIFKDTLQEAFMELDIPKGTEIFLNLPTVLFKVGEYTAALDDIELKNALIGEILDNPLYSEVDMAISYAKLPNSTIQFNRIAYIAAQRTMLIEIAMQIKELGYILAGIDTSINSTLNALIYLHKVNIQPDVSWVLMLVDNNYCRIISMQGNSYVDSFEERIAIGEVLGDAENYATVVNAASTILGNIPAKYLYVVSQTSIINAQTLADKLIYNAQIVHLDDNLFSSQSFMDVSSGISEDLAKNISIPVIGAAINKEISKISCAKLNLYNEDLGDVYLLEQPLSIKFSGKTYVLSVPNMIMASVISCVFLGLVIAGGMFYLLLQNSAMSATISEMDMNIAQLNDYLKSNDISGEQFDESTEISTGLVQNKSIYSYYTIVGTEIPKKLWLTKLTLNDHVKIEGQADNLESVYSFFRNVKDYNPNSAVKLTQLGFATSKAPIKLIDDNVSNMNVPSDNKEVEKKSILSTMNADFYKFTISDVAGAAPMPSSSKASSSDNSADSQQDTNAGSSALPPNLETIEE